jgi:hypothetical protein
MTRPTIAVPDRSERPVFGQCEYEPGCASPQCGHRSFPSALFVGGMLVMESFGLAIFADRPRSGQRLPNQSQ